MGFKIDFSEFEEYVESMKVTEKEFNSFLRDFLVEMANRVLEKTIPKTPKVSGSLRGAWKLGNIEGNGKELSIEILNPMEYATDIEYGHRIMGGKDKKTEVGWYEGRFMLKTSIDEIDRQMPLRYERKFKQFCAERGLV